MRGMSATEIEAVCGGIGNFEPPQQWEGVPQWEWDELMRLLERQNNSQR